MKNNKTINIDGIELGKIKITKEMVDEMRLGGNIITMGDSRIKNPLMKKIYKDEDCITPTELWNEIVVNDEMVSFNVSRLIKKQMKTLEHQIKQLLHDKIDKETEHLRIHKEFYKNDGIPND